MRSVPLALRELAQLFFRQQQLRQHALRDRVQVLAGLRQAQVAPFAQPDVRAHLLLQFLDAVAKCGLRHVQHFGGSGQRALAFNFDQDGKVDAFQHEQYSYMSEKRPFYFIVHGH